MASGGNTMDNSSEDEMSFNNKYELQMYMQNRLLELGFDREISDALRDMFNEMNRMQGLCFVCALLICSLLLNMRYYLYRYLEVQRNFVQFPVYDTAASVYYFSCLCSSY